MKTNSTHRIPLILLFATLFSCTGALLSKPVSCLGDEIDSVAGIGLQELRETGYRIDWMNQSNSPGLHLPTIIGSSLYTIDSNDHLTRYDLQSGKWLWSAPAGNQIYEIRSISEFPDLNVVYITTDGEVYALEKNTGNYPSQVNSAGVEISPLKQNVKLQWTANTPAFTTDQRTLVYGSTKGDAVWFDPTIGFSQHRYRIGTAVATQPSYAHGIRNKSGQMREAIIASSSDGNVIALDLNQIVELWSLRLTSTVHAPISFGTHSSIIGDEQIERTSVFIAGTDQYLRAVDLHTGKQRWNFLTDYPLVDSPFYLNDAVYQRVPNVGLVALNAFPDSLSGDQLWIADDVHGNVITTTKRGQLVTWDEHSEVLQIVDPRKGGLVATLPLPNTKELLTDQSSIGDIFILTEQDILLRLVPRN